MPNGIEAPITHVGTVQLTPSISLHEVLCIPSFQFNLISTKKLTTSLTSCLVFFSNCCLIQDLLYWTTIGQGEVRSGLYHFLKTTVSPSLLANKLSTFSTAVFTGSASIYNNLDVIDLWHCRLGHPSFTCITLIIDPIVKKDVSSINTKPCCICLLAKLHRLPFPHSQHKTSKPFEIIHCDLWGPCSTIAYDGSKFFLTIIDDFTRTTWLYLLQTKSETRNCLISFSNMIENQFDLKIKILRSDNGSEFQMTDFFNNKGIIHQRSCVATPQQNGIMEQKHQHLLNVARALKIQAGIPLEYWSDCVLTTTYLINRTPSPLL
ncbi:hypothetical protein Pint_07411 [Pistacia integerrima]|uniref:Uncharacterized protein n=1 Tax=Pistacia integerrima TaxID=434235 RepID=A0ACC0XUV0_9ROSI|nr:hypothetical protein Pint_07411 [Pistacia integerrima]